MTDKQYMHISELLVRCCDGTATKADVVRLEKLFENDQEAVEYCVEVLMNLSCIRRYYAASFTTGRPIFSQKGLADEKLHSSKQKETDYEYT